MRPFLHWGGHKERPGWKMFQAGWVGLERGAEVRLSQMPRVACFCKKAEIRQIEPFNQRAVFTQKRTGVGCLKDCMSGQAKQNQKIQGEVQKEVIGFSHAVIQSLFQREGPASAVRKSLSPGVAA